MPPTARPLRRVPSYSTIDNNSPVAVNINMVKIEPDYLPGHAIPPHANRSGAAMDLTELYYEMAMADMPHMQGIGEKLLAKPAGLRQQW